MRDVINSQRSTEELEQVIRFYETKLKKKDWRYGDRESYEHWITEAQEEFKSRA